MSTGFDIQTVGRGGISEPEKEAVEWLAERRILDGAWKSLDGTNRIFVRRLTRRAYDLLIWTTKIPPGEAWSTSKDSAQGRSLVHECLKEFTGMGLVRAVTGRPYEKFCAVVRTEQSASKGRRKSTKPLKTDAGPIQRFAGRAFLEDDAAVWPAVVSRAVRRPDGLVIQLQGQLEDGSHYRAEANLALSAGRYKGTAAMRGLEHEWAVSADVSLMTTWADDRRWELAGEWIERGEGTKEDLIFSFELELESSS